MKDFLGKNAFVVGGSAGIGLSAARMLSERGANVVLFARGQKRLEQARDEVSSCRLSPEQCFGCRSLDVADPDAVTRAMDEAVRENGAPDILLNLAGRALPRKFEDVDFDQFDQTMKINLYGIRNTCMALLPHMEKQGGVMVNTSSMAGLVGVFGYTDYCASKFAIIGFSEALRAELLPRGIKVQVLCPPDTDTPGFAEENKTKPEETRAISASAKLMTADEVARDLLKNLGRKKFLIIPGMDGKLTHLAKRWVPGVVEGVMNRTIQKVQKG